MKPTIESLQNPLVKQAVRLRESRARKKEGLILIDGLREIAVAKAAGVEFQAILLPDCSLDALVRAGISSAMLRGVSETVFEKISFGQRDRGALAIAKAPDLSLQRFEHRTHEVGQPLYVALDGVEKPGNIGAVARTVATSGAAGLVLVDPQCEVFNPNAIRSSLGCVFSVPVVVLTIEQFRTWTTDAGLQVVCARVDGATSMWDTDLTRPTVIALGAEAWGLSNQWNDPSWPAITIPMRPGSDSLNLSVSAAILTYEALRQRRKTTC